MLWLCYRIVSVLHIVTMFTVTDGEPFYQHRDHRDQRKYLRYRNENIVKNEEDAQFFLEKYGYLPCRVKRRKREALKDAFAKHGYFSGLKDIIPGFDFSPAEEEGSEVCDEQSVRSAIEEYQRNYNLPLTGELDEPTREFMSNSRCGNKDNEPKAVNPTDGEGESDKKLNSAEQVQNTDSNKSTDPTKRLWRRSIRQSKLLKILAGKPSSSSLDRRRRYIREVIEKLKKEDPAIFKPLTEEERKKRSISIHAKEALSKKLDYAGQMFNKKIIRWRLLHSGYSTRIPVEDQRATIDLAFRMWSEVIPLRFVEDSSSDIHNVDIEIAFGRGSHQNCLNDFDGNGGEVAHSWHVGNMHFDDEENFKSVQSYSPGGIYLLRVAVHEIGHVLGLSHTNKQYSVMYAIYDHPTDDIQPELELGWEDRKEVQRLYGVCKGKFSTVFDWVRKSPDNQFIYNTYFFRGNHYWMYENHANRTRYGDPLYIHREWRGVPDEVDGYIHLWYFDGKEIQNEAYFFKGENYFKYNNEKDEVYPDWPRKIADDFGPKKGETESIPNNVDSVFFDMRDKNLHFFKDEWVYVFNPREPKETRGCCVRKKKIVEEYPAAEGSKPLPSKLDVVYYSYKDKAMYFIKDEDVWVNVAFHPRQRRIHNSVKYIGKWYEKWFDICDVRDLK